jgi:hypothetical protein
MHFLFILASFSGTLRAKVHLFDPRNQHLKQESCIGFEQILKTSLPVLCSWQRELIRFVRCKDHCCRDFDATQAVLMHPHHAFFQAWNHLTTAYSKGNLVELCVLLRGEVFETSWLIGSRKRFAANAHFYRNLGAGLHFC